MKYISSKDNPIYKSALKLIKKKFRDESGKYLLEGVKPLRDALEMGISIETIFACEDKVDDIEAVFEDIAAAGGVNMVAISRELFRTLSDTETSQGVISVAGMNRLSAAGFAERLGAGSNVVILDRLQDPGNVGTIVRTAEAAGYGGVIVMKGSCDIYSPKVVRAAAGSLFRLPTVTGWDMAELETFLGSTGKKLTVTCLEDAVNCFEADLTENIALVIGNEGQGVSREMIDRSDIRIIIPMAGAIESLNAAVAAGILMYQPCAGGNK